MSGQRMKTFWVRLTEALVALLLVLGAFSIIMLLINDLFPSGSGLVGLLTEKGPRTGSNGQDLLISIGDYEAELLDLEGLAAVLKQTRRTVKRKPSDGIAWNSVGDGTPLFDLDAVQTFKGSSAQIVFDQSNRLTMGENSLIIIRRMEKDVFRSERRSQVVVVDGELTGTVASSGKQGVRIEVTTLNAVAKVKNGDGATQFSIKVNADSSSTLTVFSGRAELVAEDKTIVVEANQSATAEQGGALRQVVPLPGQVELLQPNHRSGFLYRDLPPQLSFKWGTVPDATGYRFQLAGDADFQRLLVDETVTENQFVHGNLRDGEYFWRVKALRDWAEGPYAQARMLNVTQDRKPPPLNVDFPPKFSAHSRITLNGTSERNARVLVDGHDVMLNNDGRFSHDLELQQGVNVVVVEAADAAGNVTYQSGMVYGQF